MHVWVQVPLPAPKLKRRYVITPAIFIYGGIKMKKILKLNYYLSEKVWGYEKWILSTHKNGISFICDEEKNLLEYLGEELPIIIKEIRANETLSVQVHPGDEYSKKYEGDNGKTECWYITNAKEGASIVYGIKEGTTKEELLEAIESNNVEKNLEKVYVEKGDMIYIPSGVVHAIKGDIELIEIQQSSDVTYRIYDWGRDREVHVKKALDVIDFKFDNTKGVMKNFKILETPYFNVKKINVEGSYEDKTSNKFHVYICLNGNGTIKEIDGEEISVSKGESIYIGKDSDYLFEGNLEMLKVY